MYGYIMAPDTMSVSVECVILTSESSSAAIVLNIEMKNIIIGSPVGSTGSQKPFKKPVRKISKRKKG